METNSSETPFRLHFTSTVEDLLDAFEADRRSLTGMRAWIRWMVLAVGLLFLTVLAGTALNGFQGVGPVQALVWFAMGTGIAWWFGLRPLRTRRRIRAENERELAIERRFDQAGIHSEVEGVGRHLRAWDEVVLVESAPAGVLLHFDDGVVNWLPNRAFADTDEKRALVAYSVERLALAHALEE